MTLQPLPNLFGEAPAPLEAPEPGACDQLALLEIPRTSIFDTPAPSPLPNELGLF